MSDEMRSYDTFQAADLAHLAEIARRDLDAFISRNPHHRGLENRLLLVALCQGAALHYIDSRNGVKDFDVWTFFSDDGVSPPYPVRRRGEASFQRDNFTNSTRRVDLLGRTLKVSTNADPFSAMQDYLGSAKTGTAWHLAQKAVVALEPVGRRGEVIWPLRSERDD